MRRRSPLLRYSRFSIWPALLLPALAAAQDGKESSGGGASADRSHAAAPRARAIRAETAIRVDGRLDEAVWAEAPPITEFTQMDPEEGQPVSEPTDVRLVYDTDALYVGGILKDSAPVTSRLARRDALVADSDFFVVLLDSYHDHQTAYRFATNPAGMKRDEILSAGGFGGGFGGRGGFGGGGGRGGFGDSSWDPIWDVATAVTDSGWVVEMRIPFSQLRFARADEQLWGIQIERKINRRQEQAVFAFTPKLERGGVARYGHLEGIRGISAGRKLELLPYLGGRAEYRRIDPAFDVDFQNPYRSGSDYFASAGLDLKYRVSSNFTLDATVNPDFGQVEMDPAVINLTAFETRFDEKRPFFVEGAEIFRFGEGGPMGSTGPGPQLLYSRRIGRAPQGDLPNDVVFADAPSTTTILGAAKLTGKLASGWSVGLLEAVTAREAAPWIRGDGTRGESEVEPATNYLVGRVRRDLAGGSTRFGLIGSAVNRDLPESGRAYLLRSAAYSGGADFVHEWADRTWRTAGAISSSLVRGDQAVLVSTQRSSARYFQRPDADYLGVDSAATSLAGFYAMGEVTKQAGRYQAKVAMAAASPGYEVNDLGFQTAADRIILDSNFTLEETRPGRIFRRWDLRAGPDAIWNFGGDPVHAEFNAGWSWQALNYWGGGARFAVRPAVDDDRLTRGGPLSRRPRGYSAHVNLNSDYRKLLTVRGGAQWGADESGSWENRADLTLTYKPLGNWEFRVGPEISRSYAVAQYVTSVADPRAVDTFGRRYVFADLSQTTVGLETRVNVTFSPGLSFELFAQPLVSSGDYGALKEFRQPGAFDFLRYGEELGTLDRQPDGYFRVDPDGAGTAPAFRVQDRDFNIRSLLGNAVLRWEWRQGSTLFLVWQQTRAGSITGLDVDPAFHRVGNFDLGRDARELLGIRPDNILLIKLNYWLNP